MPVASLDQVISEITAERELDLQPGALLSPEDSAKIRDEARAWVAASMKISGADTEKIADALGLSMPSTLRFLSSEPVKEQVRLLRQDIREKRLSKLAIAAESAIASLEDVAVNGMSENAKVSAAGEIRAWVADEAKADKGSESASGGGGIQINILNALDAPPRVVDLPDIRGSSRGG